MNVIPTSIETPPEATPSHRAEIALLPYSVMEAEERFYQDYAWCLNPCLTVQEAVERLRIELVRLNLPMENWQRNEVMTNIYLLACGLLNSVDDYLRGPVYQLPRLASAVPLARFLLKSFETCANWKRAWRVRRVMKWRQALLVALIPFLRHFVAALSSDNQPPPHNMAGLEAMLRLSLPKNLQIERTHIASAFRKLDLTPGDVVALARRFVEHFPDRQQPVLAAGLRTAGSYFAPLFRAFLESEGFQTVDVLTFRPDKGLGRHERSLLRQFAKRGYLAAVLDDPPVSGETFVHAADLLRRHGFASDRVVALFPVHSAQLKGPKALGSLPALSIGPDEWHKSRLLTPATIENRLAEYFHERGYERIEVIESSRLAEEFNGHLAACAEDPRRTRLKRVYEVRLETAAGDVETRFVLAKSVGVGYLSYHAFLVAQRLQGFVPPLLGLRDGLLFTEWILQGEPSFVRNRVNERAADIDAIASYTAARVRNLRLPAPSLTPIGAKHDQGLELLDTVLCKAYGSSALGKLMRSRLRRRRAADVCPVPTLIDGRMRPAEWLLGPSGLLKIDYEHHGMGKNELNVVDPAFDLAEAILHFSLSADEEARFLNRYSELAGDKDVRHRLFIYKLLAGSWSMAEALRNLELTHLAGRQEDFHRDYVRAWDFLTVHTARHCGQLCRPSAPPSWKAPLIVLDVDGVIDRRIFGFPCTTIAGIQALGLLHAHGMSIALDSARSVKEMRAYCEAYGCAGAVAEYGSYVWDAVQGRGKVLVSGDSLRQMERARQGLSRLPGVFVNDGYEFSIRACTYEDGVPVPLPTPLMRRFFVDEKLERLAWHQTTIDSTIVAAEVNKGTGLTALLDFVGLPAAQTYAVGDSEPDLAMFRIASRSFAPANISCRRLAGFLDCQVAPHPFQRGLLHIVRSLIHPDGVRCSRCTFDARLEKDDNDLILDMLRIADEKRSRLLFRALFHPAAFGMFVR